MQVDASWFGALSDFMSRSTTNNSQKSDAQNKNNHEFDLVPAEKGEVVEEEEEKKVAPREEAAVEEEARLEEKGSLTLRDHY